LPPLDLPDSNSDHATKPDRISGKKRTNFPEPTPSNPRLEPTPQQPPHNRPRLKRTTFGKRKIDIRKGCF